MTVPEPDPAELRVAVAEAMRDVCFPYVLDGESIGAISRRTGLRFIFPRREFFTSPDRGVNFAVETPGLTLLKVGDQNWLIRSAHRGLRFCSLRVNGMSGLDLESVVATVAAERAPLLDRPEAPDPRPVVKTRFCGGGVRPVDLAVADYGESRRAVFTYRLPSPSEACER